MRKMLAIGAAVAAVVVMTWSSAPAGVGKKSDSVVKTKAKLDKSATGKAVVVINLDIQPGWHLYANPVENDAFDSSEVVVKVKDFPATIAYPPGKVVVDKTVGKYKVYEDNIEIRATVDRPAGDTKPIELTVRLQSCNDKICLQPATVKLSVP